MLSLSTFRQGGNLRNLTSNEILRNDLNDSDSFFLKIRNAKKIMVLDQGFLGDTIQLMPSVYRIRQSCPACELHVMVEKRVVGLFDFFPWVDRVWGYQRHPISEPIWKQPPHIAKLRKEKFDAVINLNGSQRSSWLTWATGAKWRLGREPQRKKFFWSSFFTETIYVPFQGHIARQRYQVLDQAGFPEYPFSYGSSIPDDLLKNAKLQLGDIKRFIHISPFTTEDKKELNEKTMIELLNALNDSKFNNIALSCSSDEREIRKMKSLLKKLDFTPSKVFSGGLSMIEFATIVSLSDLHVGGPSGSIHVASMMNVPIVCWFRDHKEIDEWGPAGKHDKIFIGEETEKGIVGIEAEDILKAILAYSVKK